MRNISGTCTRYLRDNRPSGENLNLTKPALGAAQPAFHTRAGEGRLGNFENNQPFVWKLNSVKYICVVN